jgi:hypothetical protein
MVSRSGSSPDGTNALYPNAPHSSTYRTERHSARCCSARGPRYGTGIASG